MRRTIKGAGIIASLLTLATAVLFGNSGITQAVHMGMGSFKDPVRVG